MNKIREPKVKVGEIVKDYNGHEYKVLEISNEYNEVAEYDQNGMCHEYSTEESLAELGHDPGNILYCAVEKSNPMTAKPCDYLTTFVFLVSRNSKILGE